MGRVPEAPERPRRVWRRVARSDSCGSTGENAEGAKQAAPTAEGCDSPEEAMLKLRDAGLEPVKAEPFPVQSNGLILEQ